jgi:Zn-dependent protease
MKWSYRVAKIFGINVFVHATFALLLAFLGVTYWLRTGDLTSALTGIGFVLSIFVCVLLHEFGHALSAKRYNIQTRDITLYPIGGVARLERMPDKPIQELWVAAAGPVVNVAIAAALFGYTLITETFNLLSAAAGNGFINQLIAINLLLVVFNLLPAFPMDGGRILRAVLALKLDYPRATRIAAGIGQAMAVLFGLVGLLYNPFLIVIAVFVWAGTAQEAGQMQVKSSLRDVSVGAIMQQKFQAVSPEDKLTVALNLTLFGPQKDLPVVENGRVVGLLTQADLFEAASQQRTDMRVAEIMRQDFPALQSDAMADSAFMELQRTKHDSLPVVDRGTLVGLLTRDNLTNLIRYRSVLEATKKRLAALNGASFRPQTQVKPAIG